MRTDLCDVFGIDVPIFAFSHCRDVVAAVTNAGGLGVLGALAFSPEQLELELRWIDQNVDGKPYGVDTVMPMSYEGKEEGLGKADESGTVDASGFQELIPQATRDWVEKILEEYEVPPLSGTRPILLKACIKEADSAATTTSQARAMFAPAPAATPLMAARIGFSMVRIRVIIGL